MGYPGYNFHQFKDHPLWWFKDKSMEKSMEESRKMDLNGIMG